jgi:hypothetical protein
MSSNPSSPNTFKTGVSVEFIREWSQGKDLKRLNIVQVRAIIAEWFCGTIITRGVCPQDCPVCKDEVTDLFRLSEAKKPAALLVWLAKDHAAKWAERLIEAEKFPSPESPAAPQSEREAFEALFPKRDREGNIFLDLEKDYEE